MRDIFEPIDVKISFLDIHEPSARNDTLFVLTIKTASIFFGLIFVLWGVCAVVHRDTVRRHMRHMQLTSDD